MAAGGRRAAARKRQVAYALPTFDPANKNANITLTNSDRTVQKTTGGTGWASVGMLPGRNSGKYVFALQVDANTTTNGGMMAGVWSSPVTSSFVGSTSTSWSLQFNNTSPSPTVYTNSASGPIGVSGDATEVGDVFVCAVDFTAGKIWFGTTDKNWWFSGNPDTGLGYSYAFTPGTTLFPAASLYDTTGTLSIVDIPAGALVAASSFSKW